VEQVVHEVGTHPDRHAVHLDPIDLGIDPAAEHRHLAVDRDPTVLDELLAHPPTAEADAGQDLLEPLAAWLGHLALAGWSRSLAIRGPTLAGWNRSLAGWSRSLAVRGPTLAGWSRSLDDVGVEE